MLILTFAVKRILVQRQMFKNILFSSSNPFIRLKYRCFFHDVRRQQLRKKLFWDKNITNLDSAVRHATELFLCIALAKRNFDSLQINQLAGKGNIAETRHVPVSN